MNRWVLARSLVMLAAGAWMSLAFTWQPAAALQLPGDPAVAMLFSVEQAMLDLTNSDRVANGVDPLEFDPETLVIARQRAASQLSTPSLTHYDENGDLAFVQMLADAQIGYQLAGENLARAGAEDASVTRSVEQALMNSPLHRKNILDRTFTRVAIGSATDGQGQLTIAEVYRN
ncbi:MAG: CAP domain-containing protein [Chloroflexi bacterium]|nr:CAP domain-containing protein [Chloroflexota bacterium]